MPLSKHGSLILTAQTTMTCEGNIYWNVVAITLGPLMWDNRFLRGDHDDKPVTKWMERVPRLLTCEVIVTNLRLFVTVQMQFIN